jgi:hypothetical protein
LLTATLHPIDRAPLRADAVVPAAWAGLALALRWCRSHGRSTMRFITFAYAA